MLTYIHIFSVTLIINALRIGRLLVSDHVGHILLVCIYIFRDLLKLAQSRARVTSDGMYRCPDHVVIWSSGSCALERFAWRNNTYPLTMSSIYYLGSLLCQLAKEALLPHHNLAKTILGLTRFSINRSIKRSGHSLF